MVTSHFLTLLFALGVVAVFYLLPVRLRWSVLLAASLGFYLSAEPLLLLLAVGTAGWTWWVGKKIFGEHAKRWLAAGIIPCVLALFIFKYFNFFYTSVSDLLELIGLPVHADVIKIAMPLGISYYTFKLIGYLIDIYRKKYDPELHPGYFLTYALYFPQIVCGPIQRADDFLNQLHRPSRWNGALFDIGIRRIIFGLFKIMVIANPILPYLDRLAKNGNAFSGLTLFTGSVLYSILIYADFSGCSDIAIGTGNLLGLRCPDNFRAPYFSKNILEFWKRWHISLTSWLKDYIYISLGGNRIGRVRTKINIIVTFLVSGLWHGANWTFIFWGLLHGIWNVLTPRRKKKPLNPDHAETGGVTSNSGSEKVKFSFSELFLKIKSILAILATFMGVTVGWQFFRSDNIASAFDYICRAVTQFDISKASLTEAMIQFTGDSSSLPVFLTLVICICICAVFEKKMMVKSQSDDSPIPTGWTMTFLVLLILFGQFGKSAFLYANF